MKYRHKKTGLEVEKSSGWRDAYVNISFSLIVPKEIIENSNDWEKIEERVPLFKTEDGVDIYEGDRYFAKGNEHYYFHIIKRVATKNSKKDENWRYFSTLTLAEGYDVKMYTKREILEALEQSFSNYGWNKTLIKGEFSINAFKNKLRL